MRKNYALWEAEYIYDIEVAAATSPETPMEFRKLVESYRRSQGLEFKEIPNEVLEADRKRSELRLKLSQAIAKHIPEEELSQVRADIEVAQSRFLALKATYGL